MAISKNVQDALNRQINHEFYAAYLYLAMAAHFESSNLKGFASWMRQQAKEETEHAMRLYDHILDRDGTVSFSAVNAPPMTWKSAKSAVEGAYHHEQGVTKLIHNLFALARKEQDAATEVFLQWFVNEQVEEEASTREILDKVKLAEDHVGLLVLDSELAKRKG